MTTENSEKSDDKEKNKEIGDAYDLAKGFFDKAEHMKALETTEKTISDHGTNKLCSPHHHLQGDIFFELARKTDITDLKCVYLFASVDSYSTSSLLCPDASVRSFYGCASSLIQLGDQLGINKFYEKAVSKAKRGLSIKMLKPQETSQVIEDSQDLETEQLQALIDLATGKMSSNEALTVSDTCIMANPVESGKKDPSVDRLKNFWVKLNEKTKREFLVVDSRKLIDYIQNKYGNEVKESFRKCMCVLDELRWRWWKCHICAQVNYCFTDCKRHILDNHVNKFVPQSGARPKCVNKVLANMICCGDWEPVDTAAAANLVKGKAERGEEFVYVNGWCSDWPVAKDEDRKNILRQFAQVLKSSSENGTLSRTLWDLLIDYTEENLQLPEVPGSYLDKCSFFQNPQCICFLDLKQLEYILKCFGDLTTDVRTSLVSTVVTRLWENSLVKERVDLDGVTLDLLLDERLLYEGEHHFDEIETVRTYKSSGIYEHVIPKGDKIVSWFLDCPEIDKKLMSQMAEGVHNSEIWIAALRILRCTARKEVSYYDRRNKLVTYGKILGEAETLCDKEDNRKNANQRSRYALVLRMKCEERIKQDDAAKCFLNVVRDVFEGAETPRFEVLEDKESMECISILSNTVQNDLVKEGMSKLRNSLKEKVSILLLLFFLFISASFDM